jgi:phosphoenolpyruvate carboxykinase (ATP)
VKETGLRNGAHGADKFGFKDLAAVHWNLPPEQLYEFAIAANEGHVVEGGALCAETGIHTGRSPKDKFVVCDDSTEKTIWWEKNGKLSPEQFDVLLNDFLEHARGKELFAQDLYGGADPKYRIKARVFTELAWHSLFIRSLLIRPDRKELSNYVPDFTILCLPTFKADPKKHGVRSETVVALNLTKRMILIGGSFYGKTTLSADPNRTLIGDDEHGWGPHGVFNFEGGCYAKCIKLSREAEPEIYDATLRFGSVLENVVFDPETRIVDFDNESKTENTRSAYPLEFIPNASRSGRAGIPKNLVMLTADAFGVMPPIAKLTPAQAMYHFLSGYTAKVAGTEKGLVGVQPEFSTCFGAPFLPRHPTVYGNLLRELIAVHDVDCWLVNTGWTAGRYGVGRRMPIKVTRTLLTAALDGSLRNAKFRTDPYFGFSVPTSVPGIEPHLLYPFKTWQNKSEFDKTARELVAMFQKNFVQFETHVEADVRDAQPEVRIAAE